MPGASPTARLIGAATVMAEHDARLRGILPPEAARWCERMLGATARGRVLLASVGWWPGRAMWRLVERLVAPGIVRHWLLRKRRIERLAREAAAEGIERLVVLGAGLDSLAFRMDGDFAGVTCVDHPASQDEVRRAVDGHGGGMHLIDADLSRPGWIDALARESTGATLFIAEGLLMYLPEDAVRALLRGIAAASFPGSRLIATFMDTPSGGPIRFRHGSPLADAWLKRNGEPMRWSIAGDALPAFLAEAGWCHRQTIHAADLAREHDSRSQPCEGENILVAKRA